MTAWTAHPPLTSFGPHSVETGSNESAVSPRPHRGKFQGDFEEVLFWEKMLLFQYGTQGRNRTTDTAIFSRDDQHHNPMLYRV